MFVVFRVRYLSKRSVRAGKTLHKSGRLGEVVNGGNTRVGLQLMPSQRKGDLFTIGKIGLLLGSKIGPKGLLSTVTFQFCKTETLASELVVFMVFVSIFSFLVMDCPPET